VTIICHTTRYKVTSKLITRDALKHIKSERKAIISPIPVKWQKECHKMVKKNWNKFAIKQFRMHQGKTNTAKCK
jgi:hypothetical protein